MAGKRVRMDLTEREAWMVYNLVAVVHSSDDDEVGTFIGSRRTRDLNTAYSLPRKIRLAIKEATGH